MGDESVCELLEVGLGMLARARLTDGLRNSAQSCVQVITRESFMRLRGLTPEHVDQLLEAARKAEEGRKKGKAKKAGVKVNGNGSVPTSPDAGKKPKSAPATPKATKGQHAGESPVTTADGDRKSADGASTSEDDVEGEQQIVHYLIFDVNDSTDADPEDPPLFTPYGLPTILELLRVLIALLNPSDQAHTDSMRLSALAVLNTALEVGGTSLGRWPELREGVRDEGCRHLFQVS